MGQELDELLAWRPAGPAPSTRGAYDGFEYNSRLDNPLYLADIREYARERGITDKTDAEIDEMLHDDYNYRELNTLGNFFMVRGSQSDLAKHSPSEDSLARAARIHRAIEMAPTIFSKDGRSIGDAAGSIAGAVLTDPVNWGLGAVEALSAGAATPFVAGARAAISGGSRAASAGMRTGAMRAGRFGLAEGAISGGIADIGKQGLERDLGITDDFSVARLLESTALSSAFSGILGSGAGGIGGLIGGARGKRAVNALLAKGYTPDGINNVLGSGQKGLRVLQENEPDLYRQLIEDMENMNAEQAADVSPIDEAEIAAKQGREQHLNSFMGILETHLNELTERLSSLRTDNDVGLLDDQISETVEQMAAIKEAMLLPNSMEKRQKIIDELLQSPEIRDRQKGRELQQELFQEKARFESAVKSNVPEDIEAFINERLANQAQLQVGRQKIQEGVDLDEASRKAAQTVRKRALVEDAKKTVDAEAKVAKKTGELGARTDANLAEQDRLTDAAPSSTEADKIIEDGLQQEAASMAAADKAKEANVTPKTQDAADPAPEQPASQQGEQPVGLPTPPVTTSTSNTTVRASKAARKKAIGLGVDLAEIKGSGQGGRILASDIDSHVQENGASDTFAMSADFIEQTLVSASERLEELGATAADIQKYLNDPVVVRKALMERGGGAFDDDAINALMDVFESIRGATNDSGPVVFKAPEFKNKSERKFYNQRVADLVKGGMGEQMANLQAALEIQRQRSMPTMPSQKPGGALKSRLGQMDTASPVPTNEQGRPLQKLQSLLREGRVFKDADGSEYSITAKAPNASQLKLDEAALKARSAYERHKKIVAEEARVGRPLDDVELRAGRALSDREKRTQLRKEARSGGVRSDEASIPSVVQPFVANGRTRARDADQLPERGTVLYVSGRSGKPFIDWRVAARDAGLAVQGDQAQPAELAALVAEIKAASPAATPHQRRVRTASAEALRVDDLKPLAESDELGFDDFLKALVDLKKPEGPSAITPAAGADLPPLAKGNKRAFFINKQTGEVRTPSDKQIESGATARNILGKSDPDLWDIEYHDKSAARNATGLEAVRAREEAEPKPLKSSHPIEQKAFADEVYPESMTADLKAAVANVNDALSKAITAEFVPGRMAAMALRSVFDGQSVMALSDAVHKLPLSSVDKNTLQLLKAIAEIEAIIAPEGIRPPLATRAEAVDSIGTIFATLPPDAVRPMNDLINGLANGDAPRVELANSSRAPLAGLDPNEGKILISPSLAKGQAQAYAPVHHVFFHEVGHWAHMNLLSARDRVEFWDWAARNIPDEQAAMERLGVNALAADPAVAKHVESIAGHFNSPAEFFAEMFARWATGRIPSASNPAMWQRFSRYIKALFDTIINRKPVVDKELERIFLKVVPDAEAERISAEIDAVANGATTDASQLVATQGLRDASRVVDLDQADGNLADRPDYMELSIDDLIEIGDESRVRFIRVLKDVSDQVESVDGLWQDAIDTLDPDMAFEAYRETQRLLVGRTLNLMEKKRYLKAAARANKTPLAHIYSTSENAFTPFETSMAIVNRSKRMLRRINKARSGIGEAASDGAEQATIETTSVINAMTDAEAIESGLTSISDPSKAANQLIDVFSNPGDGQVDSSLSRLLSDMRAAINIAYEQVGIVPTRKVLMREVETPETLKTVNLGRFNDLGVGDKLARAKSRDIPEDERGKVWTVTKIEDDAVIMADADGEKIRVRGNAIDVFRRAKASETGQQIQDMRKRRWADLNKLAQSVKAKRIKRARYLANARRDAIPQPTLDASPLAASSKALPAEDLIRRSDSNTDVELQAIDELVSRDLVKPEAIDGVPFAPLDEAELGVSNIRRKLLEGDRSIDSDVATLANREGAVAISPRDPLVNQAIQREVAETRGVMSEAGVPASATPTMKALLLNIQSRSRRSLYTARTLTYRLLRSADPTSRDVPTSAAFVPESDEWRTLRGKIKALGEILSGEKVDSPIRLMSHLMLATDDNLASEFASRGLDDADAFRFLDGMLNPDTSYDIPTENFDLASRVLDKAGYLTNGLIQGKVRQPLARLTYFNDLFASFQDSMSPEATPVSNMTIVEAMKFSSSDLSATRLGLDPSLLSSLGLNDLVLMSSDGQIHRSPASLSIREIVKSQDSDNKQAMAIAEIADVIRSKVNTETADALRGKFGQSLDIHLRMLEDLGVQMPRYTIMAIRAASPFDTQGQMKSAKTVESMKRGIDEAIADGDIPNSWASLLQDVSSRLKPGTTNQEFYQFLIDAKTGAPSDYTPDGVIEALGYDSIRDEFGSISAIFDRTNRHAVDNLVSSFLFSAPASFEEGATAMIGRAVADASFAPSNVFEAPPAREIARSVDNQSAMNWLLNFGRNAKPKRSDLIAPVRMRHKWFGKNSERMRSAGFRTLADWYETHYPFVQQDFARRLFGTTDKPGPLRMLRALPDAPSKRQRWMANSTGRTIKPKSHSRILRALWEPSNLRLVGQLDEQERSILKAIRGELKSVFFELKDAGVMMGSRGPDFFPQIWSQKAIRRHPDEAINAFARYFEIEDAKLGKPGTSEARRQRAQNIVAKLAEVDDQTIWDPDIGKVSSSSSDHLDRSRRIELDKHPEALKMLKPFLEQDLESYLVKYFDQASHRLSLAKKFGHRNHGFGDYMTAVVKGRDGIAELLTRRRTQEHQAFAITPEDGLIDVTVSEAFPMPFEGKEYQAIQAADELIDIYKNLGRRAAEKHLMTLAIPDPANGGNPSLPFIRRARAIIDALSDFGGQPTNISTSDANFMANALKVAARRPLIDSNTVGVEASKSLRAFNSITLLSYTLFASLGDSVLPVVRSGDFRSSVKAWAKYATDPDYREAMRNIGGKIESLLHNRMTYMNGSPSSKTMSAFFNATGLTPWTDEMRSVATAVGLEAMKTAQTKALRAHNAALPLASQPAEFKRNYRFLAQVGLEEYATNPKSLATLKNLNSDKVRVGLMKFVDTAVFAPNPDEVPLWAQTPWGAVMFQLKSFPLMMQRMAKESLYDDVRVAVNDMLGKPLDLSDRKGTGRLSRGAYLVSLMPVIGMGVNATMDYIRGRGGEEGDERQLGDRRASKILSRVPFWSDDSDLVRGIEDREMLDVFVGQYLSGFATAAGLGLFASMLTDTVQQAENGIYGGQRIASTVFGPSTGTFFSGVNVMQGILDGNDSSSYPERQATREVIQRIPVLGGQRPFREKAVNVVEEVLNFDKSKKGRKGGRSSGSQSGFGSSGFGSGF